MKKLVITLIFCACLIVSVGNANAAVVLTPDNGLIDLAGLIVQANSNYGGPIFDGATFTDSGTISQFTGYNPWTLYGGLGGYWGDLAGSVSFDEPLPNTDVLNFVYTSGMVTLTVSGADAARLTLVEGTGNYALPVAGDPDSGGGSIDLLFRGSALLAGGTNEFEDGFGVAYTNDTFKTLLFSMNFDTEQAVVDFAGGNITLSDTTADIHVSRNPVPEPASMLLFGSGLFGLAGAGIKKKFKA